MALDMTTALTIAAKVTGTNQVDGLTKGLDRLTGGSNKAAVGMQRLKTAAGSALTGVQRLGAAAGIAVAAISKLAIDNINAADALSKMSQRTGIAVPQLDKFRQAADLSDTSVESMGKGFAILSKNMADAASKGTGPAAEAFNQLGIKLTDSNGKLRESDQVILEISDKFAKMEDGTEKAALAAQLFGTRLGGDLIPLLNLGSKEIQSFGTVMTQEGADRAAAFNDAVATIGEKLSKLAMTATLELLPAFEAMLAKVQEAGQWFTQLPEPVKQLATNFAAFAVPVIAIAVPLGAIAGALSGLAPLLAAVGVALTSIGPFLTSFGSLLLSIPPLLSSIVGALGGIPALIAGWAGALGPLLASLTGLGQVLIAVFTGPVGWATLAVAAGVAIYAFRDQIGEAFQAIGQTISTVAGAFKSVFIDPIIALGQQLIQFFTESWNQLGQILQAPFQQGIEWLNANFIEPFLGFGQQVIDFYSSTWVGLFEFLKQPFEQGWQFIQESFIAPVQNAIPQAVEFIKNAWAVMTDVVSSPFVSAFNIIRGALNNVISAVENGVNGAVEAINRLIQGANNVGSRIGLPQIPTLSPVKLPRFAEGGVVAGPTMALVGEGGEPEYIVPQSKAGKFAANWMAGVRGPAAIPRFAEGGMVVPSANVSIQTGPVTQMNGTNYVTTQDLSRAVQAGVNQTLSMIAGDGRIRRQLGIA